MERLLVDTSAWLAFVNRRDPEHLAVREALTTFSGRLLTTNYIFDETISLCLHRLGHPTASLVGHTLLDPNVVDIVRVEMADELAAWELFLSRSDSRYSFTDCTSLVVLRRLGLERVAALDDEYSREGFEVYPQNSSTGSSALGG